MRRAPASAAAPALATTSVQAHTSLAAAIRNPTSAHIDALRAMTGANPVAMGQAAVQEGMQSGATPASVLRAIGWVWGVLVTLPLTFGIVFGAPAAVGGVNFGAQVCDAKFVARHVAWTNPAGAAADCAQTTGCLAAYVNDTTETVSGTSSSLAAMFLVWTMYALHGPLVDMLDAALSDDGGLRQWWDSTLESAGGVGARQHWFTTLVVIVVQTLAFSLMGAMLGVTEYSGVLFAAAAVTAYNALAFANSALTEYLVLRGAPHDGQLRRMHKQQSTRLLTSSSGEEEEGEGGGIARSMRKTSYSIVNAAGKTAVDSVGDATRGNRGVMLFVLAAQAAVLGLLFAPAFDAVSDAGGAVPQAAAVMLGGLFAWMALGSGCLWVLVGMWVEEAEDAAWYRWWLTVADHLVIVFFTYLIFGWFYVSMCAHQATIALGLP